MNEERYKTECLRKKIDLAVKKTKRNEFVNFSSLLLLLLPPFASSSPSSKIRESSRYMNSYRKREEHVSLLWEQPELVKKREGKADILLTFSFRLSLSLTYIFYFSSSSLLIMIVTIMFHTVLGTSWQHLLPWRLWKKCTAVHGLWMLEEENVAWIFLACFPSHS